MVVESTHNWCWPVDGLQEAGFAVRFANTGAMQKYDGIKHTGDEAGARKLSRSDKLGGSATMPT